MKRILLLSLGPHLIPTELPIQEYYAWLSKQFEGEIFAVVSRKEFRSYQIGNFSLRGLYLPKLIRERNIFRNVAYLIFVIANTVFRHYMKAKYDVIVSKEPLVTGVLAVIVSGLCRSKAVVEFNGNYHSAFIANEIRPGIQDRLKHSYVKRVIPFVVRNADGVKLLYPDQLNPALRAACSDRLFIFSNFVPIGKCYASGQARGYIMFCGYPWRLKGADLLVRAFLRITDQFPRVSLKLVGYCPDRAELDRLVDGHPRVEFCGPVWHSEVIRLMSECDVFVLPSRTEAMGRVLLEAMACRKPIVASNVDGIPMVVKHGRNGLLFESENVEDLVVQLRKVLGDRDLANRLASEGFRIVHEQLSEACYLKSFASMIEKVLAVCP